jgi:hypothetical protein
LGQEKNPLVWLAIETSFLDFPAHSVANIPTALSWLLWQAGILGVEFLTDTASLLQQYIV